MFVGPVPHPSSSSYVSPGPSQTQLRSTGGLLVRSGEPPRCHCSDQWPEVLSGPVVYKGEALQGHGKHQDDTPQTSCSHAVVDVVTPVLGTCKSRWGLSTMQMWWLFLSFTVPGPLNIPYYRFTGKNDESFIWNPACLCIEIWYQLSKSSCWNRTLMNSSLQWDCNSKV